LLDIIADQVLTDIAGTHASIVHLMDLAHRSGLHLVNLYASSALPFFLERRIPKTLIAVGPTPLLKRCHLAHLGTLDAAFVFLSPDGRLYAESKAINSGTGGVSHFDLGLAIAVRITDVQGILQGNRDSRVSYQAVIAPTQYNVALQDFAGYPLDLGVWYTQRKTEVRLCQTSKVSNRAT
jgi:hypothetical protein